MSIKLPGATNGSVEIDVPASCGSDLSLTIPATAGEFIVADTNGDAVFSGTGSGGSSGSGQLVGYQQGTFTPEVTGQTDAGSYTYGVQRGLWTRTGNLVYAQVNLSNITTVTAGSGVMLVTGFPYSPDADNLAIGSARLDQVDFPANTVYVVASMDSAAQIAFAAMRDDTTDTTVPLSATAFASNSADVFVTITYITSNTDWIPNAGANVS